MEALEDGEEVRWGFALPLDVSAGSGVEEAELGGVEHDAGGLEEGFVAAAVDAFSEEGVTGFGEVDADLVGATGFEAAGDEGGAAEELEWFDVGDGELALVGAQAAAVRGGLDGAAAAVAAVGDDAGADGLGRDVAVSECEVAAADGVEAELLGEALFGEPGAGEDEEAGGLAVEAMDDAEGGSAARVAGVGAGAAGEPATHEFVEGSAFALFERHGGDAGGFIDDDEVGIDVGDGGVGQLAFARGARGRLVQLEVGAGGGPAAGIGDGGAVDADLAAFDAGAGDVPGAAVDGANDRVEGPAFEFGGDAMGAAFRWVVEHRRAVYRGTVRRSGCL